MLENPTIISVWGTKEGLFVDADEMRECIVELAGEIEEILGKAGSPKTWSSDYGTEVADIISHLGYIDSIVKGWSNP